MYLGLAAVLIAVSLPVGGSLAEGVPAVAEPAGPYEGTFSGYVYGDRDSRAAITLEMTQRENLVEGTLHLSEGLYVDGGRCGGGYLPASVQSASGETLSTDPNRLQASTVFNVSGLQITAEFDSHVSPDGELLTAQASIDLPWLCGRDPLLKAELSKLPQS
jgi:hypothetical protein